jgi:hypothetical protein
MKKVIFLMMALMMCFADTMFSQVDTLKFNQTEFKSGTTCNVYLMKDENSIKVGDTLIIGSPLNNGKNYTRLWFGKATVGQMIMGTAIPLPTGHNLIEVIVEEMVLEGKKQKGIVIFAYQPNITAYKYRTIFDVENAISTGEIILKHKRMTSDEALSELKKAKDKFDLGLISQEEFEKLKLQLSKYIK